MNFEELWENESIRKSTKGTKSIHKANNTNKRLSLSLVFDKSIILHKDYIRKKQEPFSIIRTVFCQEFIEDLIKRGNIFGAKYPIECIKMVYYKG